MLITKKLRYQLKIQNFRYLLYSYINIKIIIYTKTIKSIHLKGIKRYLFSIQFHGPFVTRLQTLLMLEDSRVEGIVSELGRKCKTIEPNNSIIAKSVACNAQPGHPPLDGEIEWIPPLLSNTYTQPVRSFRKGETQPKKAEGEEGTWQPPTSLGCLCASGDWLSHSLRAGTTFSRVQTTVMTGCVPLNIRFSTFSTRSLTSPSRFDQTRERSRNCVEIVS